MEEVYRQYKPLLFSLAYRMLGVVTEAEDIVQETFLSLVQNDIEDIHHMKSYLCKIVTNRCLDTLKSSRWKREQYVGEWLPEPLIDDWRETDPLHAVIKEETVSYGLLVLMDTLSPMERAVYVLRTAFGYEYTAIAAMLEKTEAGCRKLFSRAQKKLEGAGLQVDAQPAGSKQLVEQFMHAITRGDADALIQLLSQDAVLVSDGGGKTRSALRPILSDQRVVAFLLGVWHKRSAVSRMQIVPMNGQAGIMIITEGRFTIAINLVLDASRERIERIYWMVNPEKMSHLFIKP